MSITAQIREKLKEAMKEKNQVALDTLRGTLSAFVNEAVALGKTPQDELSDAEAQAVVKRLIKQRKDAVSQFEAGGRSDLVEQEKAQLAILEEFQPPQLSREEIRDIAVRKRAELGVEDKAKSGILVGAVMKETGGNADGGLVKEVIDELF